MQAPFPIPALPAAGLPPCLPDGNFITSQARNNLPRAEKRKKGGEDVKSFELTHSTKVVLMSLLPLS